jgi:hypothetical protein
MPTSEPYRPVDRPYRRRYAYVYRQHVFDKLRSLDLALAEFQGLLAEGTVIEELHDDRVPRKLVLLMTWSRPLHVVIAIDDLRREERLVTVYEPDPARWSADLTRRRR